MHTIHDMNINSVLFLSQGTTLGSEQGHVYLKEIIANKRSKMKQEWLGKRKSSSNQTAVLTQIEYDGQATVQATLGDVSATGVRFHGDGNLLIVAGQKIVLSAPKLKEASYKESIKISILLNGIDVLNLSRAFSQTTLALFNRMDLPKECWLIVLRELCAKEVMIGVITDCVGSENIYEYALNNWRAGLHAINVLQALMRGIHKGDLIQSLARRWGVSKADIRVVTSLVKTKISNERIDENAGIFSSHVELIAPG